MEFDPKIGGICGEIEAFIPWFNDDGTPLHWTQNLIGLAQYIEYKFAHFLDKSAESLFGIVSVLPGAFSGYRFDALKDEPLKAFFKEMKLHGMVSCNKKNMFLAEDWVFVLEIICQKGK